ncbi:polysaccharide pyruvyl transferase family protein [Enterococcus faecalis]|uniref:polysaccharide pyruvyl transferase family protein n=1 Tax=Enterococcus faecalis TaxID=1351 RepID=UPI001E30100B|nr:polysaccharide pyruvyl transferase family protein [Enterococcus faecalis]MCD5032917.1 polysaccharide pyruvyl transferase family protein [Enterococcus faecalis]
MKKIGIITLNGEFNYGNRLQNFALQKVLNSYNIQVDTIEIKMNKLDKLKKNLWIGGIHGINDFNQMLKKNFSKITPSSVEIRNNYKAMKEAKWEIIGQFSQKNISTFKVEKKHLPHLQQHYDIFIVGSDQVWNPNIIEFDSTHFLDFAPKEKRYSYSASFGVDQLPKRPDGLKEHYRRYLQQMAYLSVREASGVKLVRELTGKSADVAPDPTLLLSKDEWYCELDITVVKDSCFLLIYFVSEISTEIYQEIQRFATEKNLSIVQIMGDTFGENRIVADPQQFVAMIDQAQYVFTDSFHGSVFSIIMQTPFFVYERTDHKGVYTRIESLIHQFHMECAIVSVGDDLVIKENLFDFNRSERLLKNVRKKGRQLIEQKILNFSKDEK